MGQEEGNLRGVPPNRSGALDMQSAIEAFVRWVLRHRLLVLGAIVLTTAGFAALASGLKVAISSDDITPMSHPYMQTMRKVRTTFGTEAPFIVVFTAKPDGEAAMIAAYRSFAHALMLDPTLKHDSFRSLVSDNVKLVTQSDDGISVTGFLDEIPADGVAALSELQRRIALSPSAGLLFQSRDGRSLAMFAEFRDEASGYTAGHQRLLALVERNKSPKFDIQIAGQNAVLATIEGFSDRMAIFMPLAILIIGLIHYESFRNWQAVVFPILTGVIATVWGIGAYSALGLGLDPITAIVPILVLAVGAGHAVQILKRYTEVFEEGARSGSAATTRDLQDAAIASALGTVGAPLIAAASVAITAFLTLTLFDTETVRRFGFLSAAGILAIIVIEFTLIPVLRSFLPPPGHHARAATSIWSRLTDVADRCARIRPKTVLICAGAVLALSIAGIATIRLDNSLHLYLSEGWPTNRANRMLDASFAGADGFYIFIEAKKDLTLRSAKMLRAIESVQATVETDPNVLKTISLADIVAEIDAAVGARDAKLRTLPSSDGAINDALTLYEISAGPEALEGYVTADYRRGIVRGFTNTARATDMKRIEALIESGVRKAGLDALARVDIGGGSFGPISLSDALVPEKILNIVIIMIACLLITLAVMRSVALALLCCTPLFLSAAVVFGFLGFAQIPLMAPTATLGALCLGIGADYAIYMVWRLRAECRQRPLDEAISQTLATSGRAVLFVASAITGGYAVLGLSIGYHVHQWMALLVGVAMVVNAIAAIFVIPAAFRTLMSGRGRESTVQAKEAL